MYQRSWSAYAPDDWGSVMFSELRDNVWAAPLLHPRFNDVVQFKVWNGPAQIQALPEFRDDWSSSSSSSSSDTVHHILLVRSTIEDAFDLRTPANVNANDARKVVAARTPASDFLRSPVASQPYYDRASVSESDFVRFVLCHRYGGVYLDVDVIFLRDWEELWGWQGAFAYRWSRLERYNTAVLRLHRRSALGALLLRTAWRNGVEFHPIRVSAYLKDAQMEALLVRAPVALFDPAWLNAEGFELDRPPQPHFSRSCRSPSPSSLSPNDPES